VASHQKVSRTIRALALLVGLLCIGGIVFGWIPGPRRSTIGWGLTIALLLDAAIPRAIAIRDSSW